jgi:hypothetical protein
MQASARITKRMGLRAFFFILSLSYNKFRLKSVIARDDQGYIYPPSAGVTVLFVT